MGLMSSDKYILMEVYNKREKKWELTTGEYSSAVIRLKEELKVAYDDEERYLQYLFNGDLEEIKKDIETLSNQPEWIPVFHNERFDALLANVYNEKEHMTNVHDLPLPYVFNKTSIYHKAGDNLPKGASQDAENIIAGGDFHSLTIIYPDSLNNLKSIMMKNYDSGELKDEDYDETIKDLAVSFEIPITDYEKAGYDPQNIRIIVAYKG